MGDLLRTVKPAVFVGSSRRDLQACPTEVRKSAKLCSRYSSVCDNFGGDAYRTVYTVRFGDAVYVLHVFQKKSASGIATPQRHLDLIKQRLREAIRIHEAKKEGRA